MYKTSKTITKLLILLGSLVLFYFLVVFVSSVVQIAEAADRIHLGLGQPIFFILISLLIALVATPFYVYFRFPKALVPPSQKTGPEYANFMLDLRGRLKSNERLKGVSLSSDEDVKLALGLLSEDVDQVIRKTAGAVFLGTAIMQNGKLDGLISLVSQIKMVWNIACVYQQRPSPRQMIYLYSNVAASALLAESIEDIDIYEIISPMLSSAGFSALGAVPGTSIVVNSLTNGTSNAFLTLRVGCIAKQYCEALSRPNKSQIRRAATLAAAGMIGEVVRDNSKQLIVAVKKIAVDRAKAVAVKVSDVVVQGAQAFGNAAESTVDGVKNVSGKASDAAIRGAKSVGKFMGSAVDVAKETTGKVADSVAQGVQSVQKGIISTLDASKQFVKGLGTRRE